MKDSIFDVTMVELPTMLPVLPFSGTFLFPEIKLNLRIYELRYIRLVFNALAASRMIGVVQPTEQDMPMKTPSLYKTGCAGRISAFSESDDVLHITLTGISRFKILNEKEHAGLYKNAAVDFKPFAADFDLESFKCDDKRIFSKLDYYAYCNKVDLQSENLKDIKGGRLLMTLASVLPLSAPEKQALAECADLAAFQDTLLLLLDMNSDGKMK